MSARKRLIDIGIRLTALAHADKETHHERCTLLVEARDLFPSGAQFYQWCYKNVQSRLGKPYSYTSISNMLTEGRQDAETHAAKAKTTSISRYASVKVGRMTVSNLKAAIDAIEPVRFVKPQNKGSFTDTNTANEVNILVSAWENAGSAARRTFLQQIGAVLR